MDTPDIPSLGQISAAAGGLGLAASSLVDSLKVLPGGGISNVGFDAIEAAIVLFLPDEPGPGLANSLYQTLHAQWINGAALTDQKAIAKSLVKLKLTPQTAPTFAKVTQTDAATLGEVATVMTTSGVLDAQQANVLGRFDLALTAILDAAYQRADQRYRNVSKLTASVFAVLLAVGGSVALDLTTVPDGRISCVHTLMALLVGLVAVPLAPVAKDLTSAITAGVKVAQSLRR